MATKTTTKSPFRAQATTSISFGLVNVPVKVYKTVDSHDIAFHQYHEGCGGGIALERKCKECAQDVAFADIVKGIEHEGQLVTVTPDELRALQEEVNSIEVVQFIDESEVDPVSYELAYYLAPSAPAALEGYALLRHVLADSGRAALVRFALRDKLHLGVLRVSGTVLVVHTIAWPDEVRTPAFPVLDKEVTLKPQMVEMAKALVDAMTGPFKPEEWVDTYTNGVAELIASKADGEPQVVAPRAKDETDVDDLLAALEASIARKNAAKAA